MLKQKERIIPFINDINIKSEFAENSFSIAIESLKYACEKNYQ